ncbi:hypothetical protein TSOC_010608 [Tetrabaena socialis]|uniref:Uncharacterized protein n=1 Tax=Tetrabaena socialis TaxID=47790 RepID=A0A2J7ZSU7_9CHLO|nr:hypothetical protein TSOC_010608 [Tetrabaena socialis]|eukprot:PNH03341.1 hypothetical protein TSOC_010608 [Tetrabaena socialis]
MATGRGWGRAANEAEVNSLFEALATVATTATQHEVPYRYLLPLTELGLDLSTLVDQNTKAHLIDTKELTRLAPGRIKRRHMIALNRVSLLVSGTCSAALAEMVGNNVTTQATNLDRYNSTAPLQRERRAIPQDSPYSGLISKRTVPMSTLMPTLTAYLATIAPPVKPNDAMDDSPWESPLGRQAETGENEAPLEDGATEAENSNGTSQAGTTRRQG